MTAIARTCGISTMTVSRALRRSHCVNMKTRRKILEAAAQIGYQPDGRVGRPRQGINITHQKIRILLNANSTAVNLYYAYLLNAIESTLSEHECDCLLRTYHGKYDNFVWLCEGLRSEPSLPTMIVGYFPLEKLHTLLQLAPDALLVDYTENPRLTCPYNSIGFDNVEASRMAVRHLLEIGRRRIMLIKGYSDHIFSMNIEKGYREGLKLAGIKPDKQLIVSSDFTAAGAYGQILNVIDQGIKFDAVFTNDEMALGVMRALAERKKRIPDDIALVGCDGLHYGNFTSPTLTTIILNHKELGRAAVELILKRSEGKATPVRIRLVPRLEIRESTVGLAGNRKRKKMGNKN